MSSSAIFFLCTANQVVFQSPGHLWTTLGTPGPRVGPLVARWVDFFTKKVPSESSGGLRRVVRGDHGRRTLTFLPRLEKLNGYGSDHPLHLHHRKLLPEMNRRREICGRLLHKVFLMTYYSHNLLTDHTPYTIHHTSYIHVA